MTVAAAQGLTAEQALIYGLGLDPHTLYAAMARGRQTTRLYLPRDLLETDADRARNGQARTPGEELQRALAAYAATLEGDRADRLLTPEPDLIASLAREGQGAPGESARDPDHAVHRDQHAEPARTAEPQERAAQQVLDTVRRANLLLSLTRVPYGLGLADDQQLAARTRRLAQTFRPPAPTWRARGSRWPAPPNTAAVAPNAPWTPWSRDCVTRSRRSSAPRPTPPA